MLKNFQKYIQKNKKVTHTDRTLIAVSGGVDSIVLAHLFYRSALPFAIAHCNFQLRGEESEKDLALVKSLALQYQVQCYKIAFDTKSISAKEKSSIQITARQLRYDWFAKLMAQHHFDYLATAHHLNDRIETFLYNFTKGTGIRGLSNMTDKKHQIIRPLLFASKEEIVAYAKKHHLAFREDASNLSTQYSRNKIRLQAIPVLKSINPALEKTSANTFQNLEETEAVFLWAIAKFKKELVIEKNNQIHIDLQKLKNSPAPKTILHELIHPYGFNRDQIENILSANTSQSGAQFVTTNYRLFINRNKLIITDIEKPPEIFIQIHPEDGFIKTNLYNISITKSDKASTPLSTSKDRACFDAQKLTFPLTIRRWQAGDYFHPIGMKDQKQKLKKYLTNEKLSLVEKENVYVLLSGKDICWVIGRRMDERFKINEDTKEVICMKLNEPC